MTVTGKRSITIITACAGCAALIACYLFAPAALAVKHVHHAPAVAAIHRDSWNPIVRENQRPGTADWQITDGSQNGEIQAYAGEPSINTGETVDLHVSTTYPSYTIDIFRLGYYQGLGATLKLTIGGNPGVSQGYYLVQNDAPNPTNCPTCITSLRDQLNQDLDLTDANWRTTNTIVFPTTWISGLYFIRLTAVDQNGTPGPQWGVPLVVRNDARRADLVMEDPVNTDQAYNWWGGASLYADFRHPGTRNGFSSAAYEVSFGRPYAQNFGAGYLFVRTYQMDRFLEQNGYDVTYASNDAISSGKTNLQNYTGFVMGGHDEYVNGRERIALESAEKTGVSLAFFGGNDVYWQVRYALVPTAGTLGMICYKHATLDPYDKLHFGHPGIFNPVNLATVRWRDDPVNDPEDRLLKAQYVVLSNALATTYFINTSSWVFYNTGLHDGDNVPGSLGLEVDATSLTDGSITHNDRITIVASSPFDDSEHHTEVIAQSVLDEPVGSPGIIFDAGSYDWPDTLTDFPPPNGNPTPPLDNPYFIQITNNILYRIVNGINPGSSQPRP
jgi:hypothetical protein